MRYFCIFNFRKMSGLFLLASKLRAVINCYPVWQEVRQEYLDLQSAKQIRQ